jgi:hypothetical protein
MHIRVDIDGTLTVESCGWGKHVYMTRTPRWDVIAIVNALYDSKKHTITLWTSRFSEDREITELWLKAHGVHYHVLEFDKPYYDLQLDDKSYNTRDGLEQFKKRLGG